MKHLYKVIFNISVYIKTFDHTWHLNEGHIAFYRLYLINITSYDQSLYETHTVQIMFIFIDLKRKTHPAFRVLNVFYFQTYFNLRFKRKRDVRLTCQRV